MIRITIGKMKRVLVIKVKVEVFTIAIFAF